MEKLTENDIRIIERMKKTEGVLWFTYFSLLFAFAISIFLLIFGFLKKYPRSIATGMCFLSISALSFFGLRAQQRLFKIIKKLI